MERQKGFRYVKLEPFEASNNVTEFTPTDDWHCAMMVDDGGIEEGLPSVRCRDIGRDGMIYDCPFFGGFMKFEGYEWLPIDERVSTLYCKCHAPLIENK